MESRVTRLAAAVLVLAAAVLAVHYFNGTTVKAVEFSEIAKAMGEVPWMHVSSSGFERGLTRGRRTVDRFPIQDPGRPLGGR